MRKSERAATAILIGGFASLFVIGPIAIWLLGGIGYRPAPAIRAIPSKLREIARAQEHFKTLHVDGTNTLGHWRGDIAGLYTLTIEGAPIKLLEFSIAQADFSPITDTSPLIGYRRSPTPVHRYWFRAIRFSNESVPDSKRYAVCAFPDAFKEYSRLTYIMSDSKVIYSKDLGRRNGVPFYPTDPLAEGWVRVD